MAKTINLPDGDLTIKFYNDTAADVSFAKFTVNGVDLEGDVYVGKKPGGLWDDVPSKSYVKRIEAVKGGKFGTTTDPTSNALKKIRELAIVHVTALAESNPAMVIEAQIDELKEAIARRQVAIQNLRTQITHEQGEINHMLFTLESVFGLTTSDIDEVSRRVFR